MKKIEEYWLGLSDAERKVLAFTLYQVTIGETSYFQAHAKHLGIGTDVMKKVVSRLRDEGIFCERFAFGGYRPSITVSPEYFFPMAMYLANNEGELLSKFSKLRLYRSSQVRALWTIVNALCEEDYAFTEVNERNIDEDVMAYLAFYTDRQKLKRLFLKADTDCFDGLIKMLLKNHLLYDMKANGVYDFATELIDEYSKLKYISPSLKFELQDFVAMHRYLYDGTPPPTTTAKTIAHFVCLGMSSLYHGDVEMAISNFFEALKIQNKFTTGDKNVFQNPLFNYFLVLALLKSNSEASQKRLKIMMGKSSIELTRRMRSVYLLGSFGKEILTDSQHKRMIQEELSHSTSVEEKYLNAQVAGFLLADDSQRNELPTPNFAILRHECIGAYRSDDEAETSALCKSFGGAPVISTLYRMKPWEVSLEKIEALLSVKKKDDEVVEQTERIIYVLTPSGFAQVRKQVRLKSGAWSSARQVSFGDFQRCRLPYMDEQDRNISRTITNTWWNELAVHDVLVNMIGSDRVMYYKDKELHPVTIREEVPFLNIDLEGKKVKIQSNVKDKGATIVNKISDSEYCVIRTSGIQSVLIQEMLKFDGTLASETSHHLKRLLPLVSAHVEIHSDALEGGSSLEKRDGDATIHVFVDPKNEAYSFVCRVQPLKGGQSLRYPGQGEKDIFDESEGVRYHVERSLKSERGNLKQLTDFVESICDDEYDEEMGYLLRPEHALQVIEWLAEHESLFAVQWAQGEKLKIKPMATGDSIRLNSNMGWFEVEGEIKLSDASSIDIHKLLSLIANGGMTGKYVKLDASTYLALTEEMRKQMKRLEGIAQLSQGKVRISNFNVGGLAELIHTQPDNFKVNKEYKSLLKKIKESTTLEPQVPTTLNATLRDYQYEGFRWIVRLDHWGAGACLADDMGLGKTVQTIAFLLYKADKGPSLVIAPTSVVSNWKNELARFAPSLNVVLLNNEDDREKVVKEATAGDVVLTTYGLMPQQEELMAQVNWNVVCLDEAHSIKNRQTKTSAAIMMLKASSRLLLTGTPLQNYLGELWNLLQFLNPGLLGSYEAFAHKYITPENPDLSNLRRMVQPFILRRTKAEVLDELPEKTEITRLVELSDLELSAYETMRLKIKSELEKEKSMSVNALAYISRLRQAACSMQLVDNKWTEKSSKLQAFTDLLAEILTGGNRVLVFSQFTSFLTLAKQELDAAEIPYFYLDGATPLRQREKMVKMFQKGEKGVFVVSLKAGGLGLNLTGANYVIHLDPWWNPAIEQQATDRAHRIGQRQNVTVYRLISAHTIEEKILRLHKTKRDLADSFLEGTDVARTITLDDLKEFVQ